MRKEKVYFRFVAQSLLLSSSCIKKFQRRVHSGTLHSIIHSSARSGVDLLHSTPLEVVDWELDWISDGVECSYPTPGQLLF